MVTEGAWEARHLANLEDVVHFPTETAATVRLDPNQLDILKAEDRLVVHYREFVTEALLHAPQEGLLV